MQTMYLMQLLGASGFEPLKYICTFDLQSNPIDHSGKHPRHRGQCGLNAHHLEPQSKALPIKLHPHMRLVRLELTTARLKIGYSDQLSYRRLLSSLIYSTYEIRTRDFLTEKQAAYPLAQCATIAHIGIEPMISTLKVWRLNLLPNAPQHYNYNTQCIDIIVFIATTITPNAFSAISQGRDDVLCNIIDTAICNKSMMNSMIDTIMMYIPATSNYAEYYQFVCNTLQFRHCYVIIFQDYKKETDKGDLHARDRRILHTRRGSDYSQIVRRLCYPSTENKENAWIQIRRFLENKQRRILGVCSQTKKHPERAQRKQIKIATVWWHTTTKNSVALGQMVQAWKTSTKALWNSLPTFSIATQTMICQYFDTSVLHKSVLKIMGMR